MLEPFEKLGDFYVARYMNSLWEENGTCETDKWASLRLFLKVYAFERQGRSPDYAFVATDSVDEHQARPLSKDVVRPIWRSFCGRLKNMGVNHANNPLCPRATKYKRHYKGEIRQSSVRKISAVQLAVDLDMPLVAWARDAMGRQDGLKEAHKRIREINGINNKIASFFLRDVASRFQLAPAHDRHLLQPIDVWVRFVVQTLRRSNHITDDECASWIVEKSAKPESANQGIWYFCTAVGHSSQYLVSRALRDTTYSRELLREHLAELGRCGTIAVAFDSTSPKEQTI